MDILGRMVGGKLTLSEVNPLTKMEAVALTGAKRVAFAKIPEFDQLTQYVYQLAPVDGKSAITVGVAIGEVVPDEKAAFTDSGAALLIAEGVR